MRTIEEMTSEIIKKARIEKRRKRIVRSCVAVGLAAVSLFFVGYSNIITVDFNPYENNYQNYLSAYATASAGVKIVGKNSALVHLNGKAYPCFLKAKSSSTFALKNNAWEDGEPKGFTLSCSENQAVLTWNDGEQKQTQILPVASENNAANAIPAGLWSLFAIGESLDFDSAKPVSGSGWTMVLSDGSSYSAEGASAVYPSKFVDVDGALFQCLFDGQSGAMLDASAVVLDTESFAYPVLIERYLSDGEPAYFYSKQLTNAELTDFSGGTFTAAGVTVAKQNELIDGAAIPDQNQATWQLTPRKDEKNRLLSATASLDLAANGAAALRVNGSAYAGNASGKWYPLKDSVLVVLDESSPLLGKAFTVYADGESFEKTAKTYVEQADFYKVGYHDFYYFLQQTDIQVFWGSAWEREYLLPKLVFEKAYVLDGLYAANRYDNPHFNPETDDTSLSPLPENGKISLIFHQDGTMDIITEQGTTTVLYELIEHDKTLGLFIVEFDVIQLHEGLFINCLNVGSANLFMHAHTAGPNYEYVPYEINFRLTVE